MDYRHLSKHHKIEKQNIAYDRLIYPFDELVKTFTRFSIWPIVILESLKKWPSVKGFKQMLGGN